MIRASDLSVNEALSNGHHRFPVLAMSLIGQNPQTFPSFME